MKRSLSPADAEVLRAEVDKKRGFPRVHDAHEIKRVGGGVHVDVIETRTAVAIVGASKLSVLVVVADDVADALSTELRSELFAAVEPRDVAPRAPLEVASEKEQPAGTVVDLP